MKLIGFAVYLGIGAMLHAICVGPHFDWSSAWTFGWLFGWPIMVVITFMSVLVGVSIAIIVVVCLFMWLESFAEWRERRRNRRSA